MAEENLKKKGTGLDPETNGILNHLYIKLPDRSTGFFRYIRDFFTVLEFLTRIRVTKRLRWFPDDFARSVPFFSVIGLLMGAMMGAAATLGQHWGLSGNMLGLMLVLAELVFIGTLMYDGFMDTADGIFSGRTKERKLEIMQDSHVGANAVLGAVLLILAKVTLFGSIPAERLVPVLLGGYVLTRTLMVIYILHFPNARPGGLGEMFKTGGFPWYTVIAVVSALAFLYLIGIPYLAIGMMALVPCLLTAFYLKVGLGGLTGDTFGALTECGIVYYLLCAYFVFAQGLFS